MRFGIGLRGGTHVAQILLSSMREPICCETRAGRSTQEARESLPIEARGCWLSWGVGSSIHTGNSSSCKSLVYAADYPSYSSISSVVPRAPREPVVFVIQCCDSVLWLSYTIWVGRLDVKLFCSSPHRLSGERQAETYPKR